MRIGVDLGGTKIEAIALSPGGQEIARLRVTTPRDYAACLDAIAALVRELDRAGGAAGTVILGTGVGGGIVLDGRCLPGANLIAGEWGHNPLPWATPDEQPGPPCYCGKRGCVESWLSGPGFEHDHTERTGITVSGREIVRAAASGDAGATATLARYHDRLSRALASLINVLDPDVVVLGGGMSNLPGLPEATSGLLPRHVLAVGASSDPVLTRVVRAAHGDSSGVRGAAWLWPSSG